MLLSTPQYSLPTKAVLFQPLKDKLFVPCLRQPPPYPKVSEINPELHNKILKILSAEYPNVLKDLPLQKPKKQDFKAYEVSFFNVFSFK